MLRIGRVFLGLMLIAAPALGETLYAANGGGGVLSTLFILDPANGQIIETVGPIGFSVTGLAYNRKTGVLYGATGNNPMTNARSLISIDRKTGAGTLIGSTTVNTPMADLTFDLDGTLFGWSGFSGTRGLYSLNTTTGVASFVGTNTGRPPFVDGNGLASDAWGNMFGAATSDGANSSALFSVDKTTAVSTLIAMLFNKPGNADSSISALAFNSAGTLFGAVQNFDASPNAFAAFLIAIDTNSGNVTTLGQTFDRLDAIAFVPDAGVPATSAQTLILLTLLLAVAGFVSVSFRARSRTRSF